jgi:hypothetical protein
LQKVEARIDAETAAREAAEAKSRAESDAALRARESADALARAAQSIALRARLTRLLKRVALVGVALAATVWLGAAWYAAEPAATPVSAAPPAAPQASTTDNAAPVVDGGPALSLKMEPALQQVPADPGTELQAFGAPGSEPARRATTSHNSSTVLGL